MIARGGIRVRSAREEEIIEDNLEGLNRIGTST
jgi:hypothetical protein